MHLCRCFSRREKSRIGHRSCISHAIARACEDIFTIGFYTHCSRFMSRLFLRPLKAKEYDRAAAKQPVDFIACVRFLLRLPHAQTNHLMHYSMFHLLSEKSQIIPFRVIIKLYQKVIKRNRRFILIDVA